MKQRVLVISDIHGMAKELAQLLTAAHYKPTIDLLFILGDYIDRGPHSVQVLDYLLKLKKHAGRKLMLLRGNHEDMCIEAFREPAAGRDALSLWMANGGYATMKSFGDADPRGYIEFMEEMPLYAETDAFIFVHGGTAPDTPLADTDPEDLLWTRVYAANCSGKTVVVGHTIKPRVTFYPKANTLCIDTGAFMGMYGNRGRLSLVDLTNNLVHWIPTGSKAAPNPASERLVMAKRRRTAAERVFRKHGGSLSPIPSWFAPPHQNKKAGHE